MPTISATGCASPSSRHRSTCRRSMTAPTAEVATTSAANTIDAGIRHGVAAIDYGIDDMRCDKCGNDKPSVLRRADIRDDALPNNPRVCARCCLDYPGREWMRAAADRERDG